MRFTWNGRDFRIRFAHVHEPQTDPANPWPHKCIPFPSPTKRGGQCRAITYCHIQDRPEGVWVDVVPASYDPAELAQVAAGTMEPWQPQPYARLDVGEYLLYNPAGVDLEMLGEGIQRRYLFGGVAYDRANDLLYVLELFADEAAPVVHVWKIN